MLRMKAQLGREDTLWASDLFVFIKVSPSEAVQRGGFRSKWFCSSYACLVIVVYSDHDTHFHRPFTKCLDIHLLFWYYLILLMMFTGLMVSLICSRTCAALLHYLQQCSLLSTLVCVCVCMDVRASSCLCLRANACIHEPRKTSLRQTRKMH